MTNQDLSQTTNTKLLITCLVVSVIFFSLRTAARWFKTREIPLDGEDIGMYCAIIFYIIMCILFIFAVPGLYDIEGHASNPYSSKQSKVSLQEYFAAQIFYWSSLWAVKASLFFMFRRLTSGLSRYERMWWGVLIFGVLSFVGCIVCVFTSCDNLQAWFTAGQCHNGRDAFAKRVSLWFSLAVDLLTDLMIMVIPIHLLWNLKITVIEKLGVAVVFSVGIITMLFTIARAVSLNASLNDPHLSLTWNVLWGNVKGTAAIIVGCLPSFAIFVRTYSGLQPRDQYLLPVSNASPAISPYVSPVTHSPPRLESALLPFRQGSTSPRLSGQINRDFIHISQCISQEWQDRALVGSVRSSPGGTSPSSGTSGGKIKVTTTSGSPLGNAVSPLSVGNTVSPLTPASSNVQRKGIII